MTPSSISVAHEPLLKNEDFERDFAAAISNSEKAYPYADPRPYSDLRQTVSHDAGEHPDLCDERLGRIHAARYATVRGNLPRILIQLSAVIEGRPSYIANKDNAKAVAESLLEFFRDDSSLEKQMQQLRDVISRCLA